MNRPMLKQYILYMSVLLILTTKTSATDQEIMCDSFKKFKNCLTKINSYPDLAFFCQSLGHQTKSYKNIIKHLAIQQNRMQELQDIKAALQECRTQNSIPCAIMYSIKAMDFSEELAQCH